MEKEVFINKLYDILQDNINDYINCDSMFLLDNGDIVIYLLNDDNKEIEYTLHLNSKGSDE